MCMRFGRQCPGLDDGPLIIDMTQKARHGMQKRKQQPNMQTSGFKIDFGQQPASINRISQQAVVMGAFYSRFLSYFTSEGDGKDIRNKTSWLHRLPQLSADGSNDALTLAVQATASSYCASEIHDVALRRHAWDLYGQAIQTHRRLLARSRPAIYAVTLHMISTSVLFSFFEAMQATSVEAYRLHVYGAARMFEVASPNQCSEGVLCQIFFHIRTQLAFVQLTSNGETAGVDVEKIMYDTLDYEELPIFQRLTTHFTKLAEFYSTMEVALRGGGAGRTSLDPEERKACKTEIESLWHEYSDTEVLTWCDMSTQSIHFRDAFTALTIAYFSATRILLTLTASRQDESYLYDTNCYQSILDATQYIRAREIGCAYMRIAAPLLLVALHAPKLEERRIAIGYFEGWEKGSLRGISELALQTIHRRLPASHTSRLDQLGSRRVTGEEDVT
jgi:hypothetical protein